MHVASASAERFSGAVKKIDALVSLDRVECFALKKKNTQKQLHSCSKIISLTAFPWDSNVQNKFCVA